MRNVDGDRDASSFLGSCEHGVHSVADMEMLVRSHFSLLKIEISATSEFNMIIDGVTRNNNFTISDVHSEVNMLTSLVYYHNFEFIVYLGSCGYSEFKFAEFKVIYIGINLTSLNSKLSRLGQIQLYKKGRK